MEEVAKRPFFSIIIPVYNVAPYLRECLDSVLAQTFGDWEAICVDDGSTDESGVILDEYAAKDKRFRVFHQSNAGVSAARNYALSQVCGEWITFLDADDALPMDAYSKYESLIKTHDYDAYFMQRPRPFAETPIKVCEGDGRLLFESTPESSTRVVCGADLLLQNFRLLGYPVIRLLRRCVFEDMRFPVGVAMMEDNISLYDNLSVPARFAVVNLVAYAYRERTSSASRVFPKGRVLQIFEVYKKIYNIVCDKLLMSDSEAASYLLQNRYPMQYYFREGLRSEGIENLQKIADIVLWLRSRCGLNLVDAFMVLRCLIIKRLGRTVGFGLIGAIERAWCAFMHRYRQICLFYKRRVETSRVSCSVFYYAKAKRAFQRRRIRAGFSQLKKLMLASPCTGICLIIESVAKTLIPLRIRNEISLWIKRKLRIAPNFYREVKEYGINTDDREEKIFVTLTSYPKRINTIYKVINTLLSQTLKPDGVELWLAKEQFANRERDLPKRLLVLQKYGLSIKWCNDIRSFKKLVPALREHPDAVLVTADDDVYYPPTWLEILMDSHKRYPDSIVCHHAHKINIDDNGIMPYRSWRYGYFTCKPSFRLLQVGVGGVLYAPHLLYKDVIDENLFISLCPYADDLWFWAMAVLNGTKIKVADRHIKAVYPIFEAYMGEALSLQNMMEGNRNDLQLQNILKHYQDITGKISDGER